MQDGEPQNPANLVLEKYREALQRDPNTPVFGKMMRDWVQVRDNMHWSTLASQMSHQGRTHGTTTMANLVLRSSRPTYWLVHDLIAKNPFQLDPQSIATEESPARVFIYRAAGLQEVTPATIETFQRDVVSGAVKYLDEHPRQSLAAQALFRKFIDFECQGDREVPEHFHKRIEAVAPGLMNEIRFKQWIAGGAAV